MRKSILVFSLVGIVVWLTTSNVSAQTCDVALNVAVTNATCMQNGQVVVTITGEDAASIDLTGAQYQAISAAGSETQKATWVNGTYSQLAPGNYTITVEAYCTKGEIPVSIILEKENVIIGGNYTALVASAAVRRKTLSCLVTGQISVTHTLGRSPYSVAITSSPDEYTGQLTYTGITESSTILSDLPVGNYAITVSDACGYSHNFSVEMTAVSNDIYTNYTYGALYKRDCDTISFALYAPDYSHELYYYYETHDSVNKYYEVAMLLNGMGTKVWAPLRASLDAGFALPNDYTLKKFRDNGDRIYFYMRLKGDESEACSTYSLVSGAYPSPGIKTFNKDNDCDSTSIAFSTWDLGGGADYMCYPATWKITTQDDTLAVLLSGTMDNGRQLTAGKVAQGGKYILTITDADGTVLTRMDSTTVEGGQQFSSANGYPGGYNNKTSILSGTYNSLFGKDYMRVCVKGYENISSFDAEKIAPGTKLEYLSAPEGAPNCKFGPVGSTYTIPAKFNSQHFYFFGPGTSHVQYSEVLYASNFAELPVGEYKFKVTNTCGKDSIYTFTRTAALSISDFSYEEVGLTCDGLVIRPTGSIISTDALGNETPLATYFRIIRSDNGVDFSTSVISQGGTLTLPATGTYTIGISGIDRAYLGDHADSISVVFDNSLAIDPEHTSSYVCRDGSGSFIKLQAINGVAPYTYTHSPSATSNTTGEFTNLPGVEAGDEVTITITDDCGTASFPVTVTMLDLATSIIVYPQTVTVCQGDTIGLNCITLGQTTYSWRGPNNYTSPEQHPRIANADVSMSGYYVVTVTPEGCSDVVSDSILVTVISPQAPTVQNPEIELCLNMASPPSLESATNAAADEGYSLKWYDSADGTEPITPPSSLSTSTSGETIYYVSQAYDGLDCESGRVEVKVTVTDIQCGYTVSGTVFPFVHFEGDEFDEFNKLFVVTANLYALPTAPNPFVELASSTPLYIDTLVLYDGSIHVPGTPLNPGTIGLTNNPGVPISWNMVGKPIGTIDNTELTEGQVPESNIGMYSFEGVPIGDYLLVISRAGYLTRYAKITVSGDATLGHRELLCGDVNSDNFVTISDLSLLNANKYSYPSTNY
ncbi:hypothetical protein LJC16_03760, partial [Bacteroidales bacterium OttesenSCG-928-C19]|nr:hypothetical protein [Bacteroidales bacterium OttesenSCG-928-C19]